MIIPVRCFSCGKVVGNKYESFLRRVRAGLTPKCALDDLGLRRDCCRRMVLCHVDIVDNLLLYEALKPPLATNIQWHSRPEDASAVFRAR